MIRVRCAFVVIASGAIASAALAGNPIPDPTNIFVLNQAGSSGGGIYALNVLTGATSLYRTTPALTSGDANALAYDVPNDTFYYLRNSTLYQRTAGAETNLGSLGATIYDATFYNGSYWFIVENSATLKQVVISGSSIVTTNTFTLAGLTGPDFGDIATDGTGIVYGAAAGAGFFRFDLNNIAAGATIIDPNGGRLQLGFIGTTLYGVQTDTDKVFEVNLGTGALTQTSVVNPTSITVQDAAGVPIPAPAGAAVIALGGLIAGRRRR